MATPKLYVGEVPTPASVLTGLYGAATLLDVDRAVSGGVTVELPRTGGDGLWFDDCGPNASRNGSKAGGESGTVAEFDGVGVWAAEECAVVGRDINAEKQAASTHLSRVEEHLVERFMGGAVEPDETVSTVGEALEVFATAGVQPTLHVPYKALAGLLVNKFLVRDGGRLKTALGGAVAVGDYGTNNPFFTGPVVVYRSPVDIYESFDTVTNQSLIVAERSAAPVWQSPVVTLEGEN